MHTPLQSLLRSTRGDRTARPGAADRPPVAAQIRTEVLEDRTLLTGPGETLVITQRDGGSVTVDGSQFQNVIVAERASIGTLTLNAAADGMCTEVRGGARVGMIALNGAAGADQLLLDSGSNIGGITIEGGAGDDLVRSTGATIRDTLTFNGDVGADTLELLSGTRLVGDLTGNAGEDADTVTVDGESFLNNVSLMLGDNRDTFELLGGSIVNGNFFVDGGDKSDTFTFGDGVGIRGNMTLAGGGAGDTVTSERTVVRGNQTLNLAGGFDTVEFGNDLIFGSSNVNWADGAMITETAARDVRSDYMFAGGTGRTVAMLDAGGASNYTDVGGNFSFTTAGTTRLEVGLDVDMGNFTVNTGQGMATGRDRLTVLSGTSVEGNFNVTLGGDEADDDVLVIEGPLSVGDEPMGINGNFIATLGGGNDRVRMGDVTVNGNQTINLGNSTRPKGDVLRLGEDQIFGDSIINWAGGALIRETAMRMIASDYQFGGGNLANEVELNRMTSVGTGSSGNFSFTATAPSFLTANVQVMSGNLTVQPGVGNDRILLDGATASGNFSVSTEAGRDLVSLNDAMAGGNSTVSLSGDDDRVDNRRFTVTGSPSFNGGAGTDSIANPNQGTVTGFEA